MEKYILSLILVISCYAYSQPLRLQDDNYNLDSIAKSNVENIVYTTNLQTFFSFYPFLKLRVTASIRLNKGSFFVFSPTTDYFDFGLYDIRAKYTFTPTIRITQRVFIPGNNKWSYTTGVVIKL
jgi:hypothetical protein